MQPIGSTVLDNHSAKDDGPHYLNYHFIYYRQWETVKVETKLLLKDIVIPTPSCETERFTVELSFVVNKIDLINVWWKSTNQSCNSL